MTCLSCAAHRDELARKDAVIADLRARLARAEQEAIVLPAAVRYATRVANVNDTRRRHRMTDITTTPKETTMMDRTLADVISITDTDVLDHLDRQVTIPALDGIQPQGDIIVIPVPGTIWDHTPVPAAGVPVVRGEAGGNTHLLVGDGPVSWAPNPRPGAQTLGEVTVPVGAVGYLLHPEHGAAGIAPGDYVIRRQREQADAVRLVAD